MSSHRGAAKTKTRRAATVRENGKASAAGDVSADAKRLAGTIERELKAGRADALSPQALQSLMGALCNTYAAQTEGGAQFTPIPERTGVSPTAVMVTASGLLRAANLAVFELGMWQSWTGR